MTKMDDDKFGVSKEVDSKKSDGGGGSTDESNLFPKRKMMMMMMVDDHDLHDNHHCPFTSDSAWRGADVGGSGPICNNNSRPKTSSSCCIGDVIGGGVSTSADAATALNTLQPFDIGAAAAPVSQIAFKSPEGYMAAAAAASMGFPFTNAQWKELERQAMIYKYMMASLPVPPQLLIPALRNPSPLVGCGAGGLNLIRLSNGGDLEPGRCRRTDGKKWRCSRDVAPDQKYCERHLHRGRHRSRKPVELPPKNNINKKTLLEVESNPPPNVTHVTQPSMGKVSIFESLEQQRCWDWMMKGEQWQGGSVFTNQDMVVSLENQHQMETPIRGFIDAWSNGVTQNHNNNSTNSGNISSNGNLSLSPLSLSMGGTTTNDDQMGLGVSQTGHQDHECSTSTKLPFSSWLPAATWVASTPGGPLAEVLRPSTVNGDSSSSPQATTLSSPSGVLQKTLAASSWSDSSGSSSPTLSSSNANNKPIELALLGLNQGKLASST